MSGLQIILSMFTKAFQSILNVNIGSGITYRNAFLWAVVVGVILKLLGFGIKEVEVPHLQPLIKSTNNKIKHNKGVKYYKKNIDNWNKNVSNAPKQIEHKDDVIYM